MALLGELPVNFLFILVGVAAGAIVFLAAVLPVFLPMKSEPGCLAILWLVAALCIAVRVGAWVRTEISGEAPYKLSVEAVNAVSKGKLLPSSSKMAGILVVYSKDDKNDDDYYFDRGRTMSIPEACRTRPGEIPGTVIIVHSSRSREIGYCHGAGCTHKYYHYHYGVLLHMRTGQRSHEIRTNPSFPSNSSEFPDDYFDELRADAEQQSCPSTRPQSQ